METRPLEIKYRDEEDEVAPAWQLERKGGYDRNRSTRLSLLENNESLFIRRRFSMIRVGFERRFARRLRNRGTAKRSIVGRIPRSRNCGRN